jgi:ribonuclease HI
MDAKSAYPFKAQSTCCEDVHMQSVIWTDGSSSIKSGWCGWAYHGSINGQEIVKCGYEKGTNQRAELHAMVEALRAIPVGCVAEIISDSAYSINCLSSFREKWEYNGFLTYNGHPISHLELVKEGHRLMDARRVTLTHVKGHSGVGGNELADVLSKSARYVAEGRPPMIDVLPFLVRGE